MCTKNALKGGEPSIIKEKTIVDDFPSLTRHHSPGWEI